MEIEANSESSLRAKLSLKATTLSERVSILYARDKLLRSDRQRQTDLATAVAVVGTCPDMCPEYERYFRVHTKQMSIFELNDKDVIDFKRMVKEYRRSGADQEEPLPHELRPIHVLNRTMDYLCTNIMDDKRRESKVGDWYDFVWSRTRSIRKDITQQYLCDLSSVALIEKCARFHIHCAATLCEEDLKDYDPKINEECLANCLKSLSDLYSDLSLRSIYCTNEAEFRAYEILINLDDGGKKLLELKRFRKEIRDSSQFRFAIQVYLAYHFHYYIKFFNLVKSSDYLISCILHRYFNRVRLQAFSVLRKSFTSSSSNVQKYPTSLLVDQLCFEGETDAKKFCNNISLECSIETLYLVRGDNCETDLTINRSHRFVENKRNVSLGQIISGDSQAIITFKAKPVHNSFDLDGFLKTDAYQALDQQKSDSNNSDVNESNDFKFSLGMTQRKYRFRDCASNNSTSQSSRSSRSSNFISTYGNNFFLENGKKVNNLKKESSNNNNARDSSNKTLNEQFANCVVIDDDEDDEDDCRIIDDDCYIIE